MTRAQGRSAGIAIATVCLALAGAAVKPGGPAWSVFGNALWAAMPFVGLFWAQRMTPASALTELGLRGSVRDALVVALMASVPTVLTLALGGRLNSHMSGSHLLLVVAVAPVAEEVLFRGYLFKQLYRRAGWSFWAALGTSTILFALIHVHHVSDLGTIRLLSELAIVSAGGVLFAWLFVQWNDNLWVPIGAHAAMNLWEVFDVDSTAIGTPAGNFARLLFVAVVVTMTVRRTTHTNGSRVP